MNHEYLIPLRTAYTLFPLIAAFFTLPYITYQYHRYGSIVFFRAAVVYSFILYLICAYFYAIMPLPTFEYVLANPLPYHVQLNPLSFLDDVAEQAYWIYSGIGTVNISHSAWFQVCANMFLFVPFGIYLRYYFKRRFPAVLLLSLALSLFLECTQLSALYGLYPAPYRIFDIDDLLFNTLGGLLGFFVTPSLTRQLPSKDELNRISYERGRLVTLPRRFLAMLIDLAILFFLWNRFCPDGILPALFYHLAVVLLYFAGISRLTKGYTPGKFAVSLRLTTEADGAPSYWQYCLCYGLLYFLVVPIPVAPLFLAYERLRGHSSFFYERLSKTICRNTANKQWKKEA